MDWEPLARLTLDKQVKGRRSGFFRGGETAWRTIFPE